MADPFKYNPDAQYPTRTSEEVKYTEDPTSLRVVVHNDGAGFDTKFPGAHLKDYIIPKVVKKDDAERWRTGDRMNFYQNQVNFAVWASTSGCGVSVPDHLNAQQQLMRAMYRFHFYYTVRRILSELHVALPGDTSFDALNNQYDNRAYVRLADEFKVGDHADWSTNNELGVVHLRGIRHGWKQKGWHYGPDQYVESWTTSGYDPTR